MRGKQGRKGRSAARYAQVLELLAMDLNLDALRVQRYKEGGGGGGGGGGGRKNIG